LAAGCTSSPCSGSNDDDDDDDETDADLPWSRFAEAPSCAPPGALFFERMRSGSNLASEVSNASIKRRSSGVQSSSPSSSFVSKSRNRLSGRRKIRDIDRDCEPNTPSAVAASASSSRCSQATTWRYPGVLDAWSAIFATCLTKGLPSACSSCSRWRDDSAARLSASTT